MPENILIIKLGALGDFVQALGPFAAIRRHHAGARVTLLTTPPYADFAAASPYFDEVWTDSRPAALRAAAWLALRRRLRGGDFARVYDLQTSSRSSFYFRLFWPGPYPEWSGIAKGCSHLHANPERDALHTFERQAEQLAIAGIARVPPPDLSWVSADVTAFSLPAPFVLLAPGGASHRPHKRWPVNHYAALAHALWDQGVTTVLLGAAAEATLLQRISGNAPVPYVRSLAGQTSITDIAALARGARFAIGNDTGPMHLTAAVGCPSVVLYSHDSDPALCAQRGPKVSILRRDPLAALEVSEVLEAAAALTES